MNFWKWFFWGEGRRKSGLRSYLLSCWLILHGGIGALLAYAAPQLSDKAFIIMLPFVSCLLAFALSWTGNVVHLLNTNEVMELSNYYKGGMRDYAFSVQATILILFITVVLWVLSGLGFFEGFFGRMIVFSISSFAVHECWNLSLFLQVLTIARSKIALRQMQLHKTQRPAGHSNEKMEVRHDQ